MVSSAYDDQNTKRKNTNVEQQLALSLGFYCRFISLIFLWVFELLAEVLPVVHHQFLDSQQRMITHVWIGMSQQLHHVGFGVQRFNNAAAVSCRLHYLTHMINMIIMPTFCPVGNDEHTRRRRGLQRRAPRGLSLIQVAAPRFYKTVLHLSIINYSIN